MFIGCAVGLAVGSLALSQTLIVIFPDGSGSHFHYDNALTLDELAIKQYEPDRLAEKFHLSLSVADYDEKILTAF